MYPVVRTFVTVIVWCEKHIFTKSKYKEFIHGNPFRCIQIYVNVELPGNLTKLIYASLRDHVYMLYQLDE